MFALAPLARRTDPTRAPAGAVWTEEPLGLRPAATREDRARRAVRRASEGERQSTQPRPVHVVGGEPERPVELDRRRVVLLHLEVGPRGALAGRPAGKRPGHPARQPAAARRRIDLDQRDASQSPVTTPRATAAGAPLWVYTDAKRTLATAVRMWCAAAGNAPFRPATMASQAADGAAASSTSPSGAPSAASGASGAVCTS